MKLRIYADELSETADADAKGCDSWRSHAFDSVTELVEECEKIVHERGYEIDDPSWTGRDFTMGGSREANMRLALDAAFDAQRKELDLVDELSKEFQHSLEHLGHEGGLKPQMKWSSRKGRVDAHRVLAGEEKFRRGRENFISDSGVVSLVVDIGQNSDVCMEKGFMRAAAALAATEFLEVVMGLRVNLWAVEIGAEMYHGSECDQPNLETAWRIKAADRPLNLSVVTASMTTWFFRTTCFQTFFIAGEPYTGLGRSAAPTIEQARRLTGDKNSYLLTAALTGSVEDCRANAIKAAKQIIENAVTNSMTGYKNGSRWNNTDMYA